MQRDRQPPRIARLPCLGRRRDLDRRGFAIGSHCVEHPILHPPARRAARQELRESKATVERERDGNAGASPTPTAGRTTFRRRVSLPRPRPDTAWASPWRRPQSNVKEPLAIDRICVVREMTTDAFHARVSGAAALYHRIGGRR